MTDVLGQPVKRASIFLPIKRALPQKLELR